MIEIRKTVQFVGWLDGLRDIRARSKILVRIQRMSMGNFGDVAPVGAGVSEMRIDYGPGYRVYFTSEAKPPSSCLLVAPRRHRAGI